MGQALACGRASARQTPPLRAGSGVSTFSETIRGAEPPDGWGRRFRLPACAVREYRGRLPHFHPDRAYLFLTWRLWRGANRILGRTGQRFWQDARATGPFRKSYDHYLRHSWRLERTIAYIEHAELRPGPARAGRRNRLPHQPVHVPKATYDITAHKCLSCKMGTKTKWHCAQAPVERAPLQPTRSWPPGTPHCCGSC